MTVGVGCRQLLTAAGYDIVFQGVLRVGGVGLQRVFQAVDQDIRLEVIEGHAVDLLIRRGIAVIGADTNGRKKSVVLRVGRNAVQQLDMFFIFLGFRVKLNVSDLDDTELHALQRVSVSVAVLVQMGNALRIVSTPFSSRMPVDT